MNKQLLLKTGVFILIFYAFAAGPAGAQNCGKAWMYLAEREQLSEEMKEKYDLEIPAEKIRMDFMKTPAGLPYFYAGENLDSAEIVTIFTGKNKEVRLHRRAAEAWQKLRNRAAKDGIKLEILSAFRTWSRQKRLYQKYGSRRAEKPGWSEHHLYTALDLDRVGENSAKFLWLLRNAFALGWAPTYYFRTGSEIRPEPWHWRYIGELAAEKFRCSWEKEIGETVSRIEKRRN